MATMNYTRTDIDALIRSTPGSAYKERPILHTERNAVAARILCGDNWVHLDATMGDDDVAQYLTITATGYSFATYTLLADWNQPGMMTLVCRELDDDGRETEYEWLLVPGTKVALGEWAQLIETIAEADTHAGALELAAAFVGQREAA